MNEVAYVRVNGTFVEKQAYIATLAIRQAEKAEQRKRDEQRKKKNWFFRGKVQ